MKFYDISKIEKMKDELIEFKRGEKMDEQKAQNFINELHQLFKKYELFIDPYMDSYDNVTIDIIDKNENVVFSCFEMNYDDYSLTAFYHDTYDGMKVNKFITNDKDDNNE